MILHFGFNRAPQTTKERSAGFSPSHGLSFEALQENRNEQVTGL
jgi:hypothetical protein